MIDKDHVFDSLKKNHQGDAGDSIFGPLHISSIQLSSEICIRRNSSYLSIIEDTSPTHIA